MNTTSSDEKPKKEQVIVIFQGGSALGAYECGAFEIIADEIDKHQEELAVVAGTSIGAVNAAIIAKSYKEQQGAGTEAATTTAAAKDLRTFWTTVLPTSFPQLFPPYPGLQFPLAGILQRSLNLWISLLRGTRICLRSIFPRSVRLPPLTTVRARRKKRSRSILALTKGVIRA